MVAMGIGLSDFQRALLLIMGAPGVWTLGYWLCVIPDASMVATFQPGFCHTRVESLQPCQYVVKQPSLMFNELAICKVDKSHVNRLKLMQTLNRNRRAIDLGVSFFESAFFLALQGNNF